jgi:hypothetical protein
VRDVSAMLVETMHFRSPASDVWKIFACRATEPVDVISAVYSGNEHLLKPAQPLRRRHGAHLEIRGQLRIDRKNRQRRCSLAESFQALLHEANSRIQNRLLKPIKAWRLVRDHTHTLSAKQTVSISSWPVMKMSRSPGGWDK